jgi:curved DNA-binding protein CbpA
MSDHYELLGVEPDATKDEIKAAYRSEVESADTARRAELNRAWNVLSDPIQRQRYDDQRATVDDADDESDDVGAPVVVPGRRATGARRGPQSKALEAKGASTNGSGSNGSGGGADDGPPPRNLPTIPVPDGLVQAPAKARSLAMLFDFSVLIVIFLLVQFAGAALIKNQYPTQVNRVDTGVKQSAKVDKAKSKADDAKDKANSALASAKKKGDSAAVRDAQDKADAAKAKASAADKKAKQVDDDLANEQGKLQPMYLLIQAVVLVLALLYCVPVSARTGQTLGKRFRKLRLVRVDGSPPGWGASLVHYGVPIFLGLALLTPLGPLALILALGSVLWNIRDKNRQGVHDKLAKTFVVEA